MNYNPYAAPQAMPPQQPPPMPGGGEPLPWEIGEVLGQAWEVFKANWGVLLGSLIVAGLLSCIPFFIGVPLLFLDGFDASKAEDMQWQIRALEIPVIIVAAFFTVGLRRIALSAARGGSPEFGMLFSGGSLFIPMVGLMFLYTLGSTIATMMLILPGIAFLMMFWMADYFLVDAGTGVIGSFGASFRAMRGQWGMVLLFGLVVILLSLAGGLACCVGVFVTAPLIEVAKAIVFLRISGRGAPPTMGGQQPYYGGPPPGYGGPPPGYGGPPPGYGGPPPGYGGGGSPPGYGGPPPGYGPPR